MYCNDLADNELRFREMDISKVRTEHDQRLLLRISWTEHVSNEEVFNRANTKPTLLD